MDDFYDTETDENLPLYMESRDVQEFAAWIAVLPPEAIEQIRLKIEELSKKDRYKNKNNQENRDKKLAAWDPDFTKLTPQERRELEEAEADPEIISIDDIDWD